MPPPTGTDRRYGYIRVLAKELLHSRAQYQEKHWKFCCQWIAQIGIAEVTLPSRHAVQQLTGLGIECIKLLKQAEDEKELNIAPPKRGYCSAAAAMLVALLEYEEASARQGKPSPWRCPKGTLIEQAGKLMSSCSMQTFKSLQTHLMASDAAGGARCASLQQMQYLKNQGLVTQRAKKGACPSGVVYELTERGRLRALSLRKHGEAGELLAPKRSHRRVQPGERGVVLLLVDHREGGGEARKGYWELTRELERQDVGYETRALEPGAGDFQLVLADGPVVLPPVTAPGRERRLAHTNPNRNRKPYSNPNPIPNPNQAGAHHRAQGQRRRGREPARRAVGHAAGQHGRVQRARVRRARQDPVPARGGQGAGAALGVQLRPVRVQDGRRACHRRLPARGLPHSARGG